MDILNRMTIGTHSAEAKDQQTGSPLEVLRAFLKLGVTCFGSPIAHIGYFREMLLCGAAPADDPKSPLSAPLTGYLAGALRDPH